MTSETVHDIIFGNAARVLYSFDHGKFDLAITSPPYPMISMWDDIFCSLDDRIRTSLQEKRAGDAFELMHLQLDDVWKRLYDSLSPGGLACINIGDATRSIGGSFHVFPNHARILRTCVDAGFDVLPEIIWRKQSNKPNKFLGSGMLPPGAYATQEHEFIIVLRKGGKRIFKESEMVRRRYESAYFWEERNAWFSDIWEDIRGERQVLANAGRRTAAFPLELCYRLICMFSIAGDTILDPFLGTGTTTAAAIAAGRNSVGVEIDSSFRDDIYNRARSAVPLSADLKERRLDAHRKFISGNARIPHDAGRLHVNSNYGFPVVTAQETELLHPDLKEVVVSPGGRIRAVYL